MDTLDIATQVSNYATTYALDAWNIGANFIGFGILTLALLLYGMKAAKGGIIALIVSLYAGYAIYSVFPFTTMLLGTSADPVMKAVISVGIFIVSTILPFHFAQRLVSGGFGVITIFPNFFLALLTAAFLFALGYHSFDLAHIYSFPEPLKTLFVPDQYYFWWFIAPLIGLILFVH